MRLQNELQRLIDSGALSPAADAPRIVPLYDHRPTRMRTAYSVGEAVSRTGTTADAKLESSARRNPIRGR
jgi:hypothetical protein